MNEFLVAALNDFLAHPASSMAYLMLIVLTAAILLALVRLALGPQLPDRAVALDVIATLIVGLMGTYAVAESEPLLLRVAMVLALVNFLGTVAYSFYLQRRVST